MADAVRLEERTVEVNVPELSADANQRLTAAVREVVGSDCVRVPVGRVRASQGERPPSTLQQRMTSTMAMMIGTVAVAVCVGLIILTSFGGHWYLTGLAFVVLAIALAAVTMTIMGLASTSEYPDPGLVALLSEEGVRDPEVRFSELVHEFTPVPNGEGHRTVEIEDDPGLAAAEQTESGTPSSGPSTAVGPGSGS